MIRTPVLGPGSAPTAYWCVFTSHTNVFPQRSGGITCAVSLELRAEAAERSTWSWAGVGVGLRRGDARRAEQRARRRRRCHGRAGDGCQCCEALERGRLEDVADRLRSEEQT